MRNKRDWQNPIIRVAQQDWENGDCGLACVAMVTGLRYQDALLAFRKLKSKSKTFYTYHKDLEAMLASLGFRTVRKRFTTWRVIDTRAIVKVNVRKDGKWHWVVADPRADGLVAHDPKPCKQSIITDFRGLKGSGYYIAVVRGQ